MKKIIFIALLITICSCEQQPVSVHTTETDREMNGKFGWFSSYGKSYNLPEYYTGWELQTQEDLDFYLGYK